MKQASSISVFIVDDENLARARLKRLLADDNLYRVCGEAENGELAIQGVKSVEPDIVLLDIRMPGIDGLEVAEQLSKLDHPPAIIFCTAFDEYAIEAFKYRAIGYLLKPASSEELHQALTRAKQLSQLQIKEVRAHNTEEKPNFIAHSWQGDELIPFESIYFFRSDHKYMTVFHQEGETLSDQTLKDLERLHPEELVRVHRNTLVNIKHVASVGRNNEGQHYIQIRNSKLNVLVSRRHVSTLKQRLNSFD